MSLSSESFPTSLFTASPGARFAVTLVTRGSVLMPARGAVHRQVARVREEVFVGGGHLHVAEQDADDCRAYSVAVVENLRSGLGRVCGHVRLIPRGSGDSEIELPIEHHFAQSLPQDRTGRPALAGAFEVSRLCVVHERASARDRMLMTLLAYAAGLAGSLGWGDAYAMLGSDLVRVIRRYVPTIEELAGSRLLDGYPSAKTPVRISREGYRSIAIPAPGDTFFGPDRG
jgi:hypothetical protein